MIYLIDSNRNPYGHHLVYLKALHTIKQTQPLQINIKEMPQNSNKLLILIERTYNFYKQLKAVPKNNIAHFLYADIYYPFPYFIPFNRKRKVIFTFHSCPHGKLKHFLIRNFCSKADLVIVHSEYIYSEFRKLGLSNVKIIDYPSFYDYSSIPSKEKLREQFGISKNKVVISTLGATRPEKGLDILIESFKYIPKQQKEQIIFNMAGMPISIKKETISFLCEQYNIQSRLTMRHLTEKEFMENVKISDYIILPYRKRMTGNSGPMTEAIVNDIPVIVPDCGNLGNIATKNNIGVTFHSEDSKDLAKTILKELEHKSTFDFSFKKNLTVKKFIAKYEQIYKELNKSIDTKINSNIK